jgi:hypothetical protein
MITKKQNDMPGVNRDVVFCQLLQYIYLHAPWIEIVAATTATSLLLLDYNKQDSNDVNRVIMVKIVQILIIDVVL